MFKYFALAAALVSIGKAALTCDGAVVTEMEGNETYTSVIVAGACISSSSANLTVSYNHECTDSDITQYFYANADCSGTPVSETSACTGDGALGICEITCTGTPCDYIALTYQQGFTECDGTMAVEPVDFTVTQPFPIGYCQYDAFYDESSQYTVEDGVASYSSYDGEGCVGNPTYSVPQEDTCDTGFGGFAIYSMIVTMEEPMTTEPMTTEMLPGLECDGAVIFGQPFIAGTCQAVGNDISVMYACNEDGDDLTMTGYNSTDCSGDSFATRELCSEFGIDPCPVTCDGIQCDVVTMMTYMNVTECTDGTPDDGILSYSVSYPLDFCIYGTTLTSDDGSSVMINDYDNDECVGQPSLTESAENMCNATMGYAVVFSLDIAPTAMPTATPGSDGEDGQSMIGSAVSVTFVCFVLSFLV